jgi:hypothetical protein
MPVHPECQYGFLLIFVLPFLPLLSFEAWASINNRNVRLVDFGLVHTRIYCRIFWEGYSVRNRKMAASPGHYSNPLQDLTLKMVAIIIHIQNSTVCSNLNSVPIRHSFELVAINVLKLTTTILYLMHYSNLISNTSFRRCILPPSAGVIH